MKGRFVPWIDGVRDSLTNPEERRVYLQEAVRSLLAEDPDECAATLHLFFHATCGYAAAGEKIGMSAETVEQSLRQSSTLTLQQFGRLIQFALQQDSLQIAPDFLTTANSPAGTLQQQAA